MNPGRRSNPGKSPARLSLWALFAETLWLGPEVHAALPEMKKGGQRKGRPCCDTAICIIGESSRSCVLTLPAWRLSKNFGIVVIVVLVCAE